MISFFVVAKFPPEQNGMAAHVHVCVHTFISIDRDNYQRLSYNDVILFKSIVQSIQRCQSHECRVTIMLSRE